MKSIFTVIGFCVVFGLLMPPLVTAHGTDDHEHTVTAPIAAVALRASAQTEDFELVAVLQGRHLLIYLDRFADNAAVSDAKIELESGSIFKAQAKQTSPGIYMVDLTAGVLEKAGKYPLAISVQTGDLGDVMTAILEIPDERTTEQGARIGLLVSLTNKWMWLVAGFVVLGSLIGAIRMMQRRVRANVVGGGK